MIANNGKVVKEWRSPDIRGHVLEVIEAAHKTSEGFEAPSLKETLEEAPVLPKTQAHEQLAAALAEVLDA